MMKSNSRQDPVHWDGGASFLHMGLTLYGERSLRLRHVPDTGGCLEVDVPMNQGHVYLGCLCGPEHFVVHRPTEHLFPSANLGPVEVVLLLRSRCFRDARASTQAVGPVPKDLWDALAAVLADSLRKLPWRLPSLAECRAEEEKLVG